MKELLSPKQVARAIGVSESSLKRWCDRGLLPVVLTAGGHRRLPINGVISFLRETKRTMVHPDVLGLPATAGKGATVVSRAQDLFLEALLEGNEPRCRQIMLDLYLAEMPVLDICDRVIAGAFHRVGEHWECGEIEVYRERRACNLGLYAINDLRSFLPQPPASAPVAIGGAIEGDHYSLPTAMVEVVLRSLGWNATSLGSNLPLATLAAACREVQPRLLWLSASHVVDSARLVADYQSFLASVPADLPVVVGGQGLTHDLRKQLSYSAFCDTMRHLESFAGTLGR